MIKLFYNTVQADRAQGTAKAALCIRGTEKAVCFLACANPVHILVDAGSVESPATIRAKDYRFLGRADSELKARAHSFPAIV